jgi:hypothetical protein
MTPPDLAVDVSTVQAGCQYASQSGPGEIQRLLAIATREFDLGLAAVVVAVA